MDLIVAHVVLVEFVIVIVEWVVVMSKFLDGIGGDGIVAIVWFSLLDVLSILWDNESGLVLLCPGLVGVIYFQAKRFVKTQTSLAHMNAMCTIAINHFPQNCDSCWMQQVG